MYRLANLGHYNQQNREEICLWLKIQIVRGIFLRLGTRRNLQIGRVGCCSQFSRWPFELVRLYFPLLLLWHQVSMFDYASSFQYEQHHWHQDSFSRCSEIWYISLLNKEDIPSSMNSKKVLEAFAFSSRSQ